MVGPCPHPVKPHPLGQVIVPPGEFAGLPTDAADCSPVRSAQRVSLALLLLPLAALALLVGLGLRHRGGRRQAALAEVLDAADALEERLRVARGEIEAIAGSDANPVRDAMQEMLRQRLWLQQHGQAASLEQLGLVRDTIVASRHRIDHQLLQIERARAPVA